MPFINLKDLDEREIVSGFSARFVHTENMTVSYWNVKQGASLPAHAHIHEQVTNLLEGQFELTVGDESKLLTPGQIAVIPSNISHSGKALTDCRIMDIFCPVREDYK